MSQLEKSSSGVTVGLTQSELMVRQFSIRYSGTTLAQPHSSATVECWDGVHFNKVLLPTQRFFVHLVDGQYFVFWKLFDQLPGRDDKDREESIHCSKTIQTQSIETVL